MIYLVHQDIQLIVLDIVHTYTVPLYLGAECGIGNQGCGDKTREYLKRRSFSSFDTLYICTY